MPDEPIIVSGGSVTIDFKDSFQQQPSFPQGTQSYTTAGRLIRLLVNDKVVSELDERDVVTIIYNTD